VGQLRPDTVSFTNGLLQQSLNPVSPEDNVLLSARYLVYLLGRTGGDVARAVAAYAQGLASLQREGMHPGTRQYVADVLALRDLFAP
jgi:soluble lytic murein transglycosylase-like protein